MDLPSGNVLWVKWIEHEGWSEGQVQGQFCGLKEKKFNFVSFTFLNAYVNLLIGVIMPTSGSLSIDYHQFAMNSAWKRLIKTEILPASVQMSWKGKILIISFLLSLSYPVHISKIQTFFCVFPPLYIFQVGKIPVMNNNRELDKLRYLLGYGEIFDRLK